MNHRLVQASRVVLHAYRLVLFVERKRAYPVNLTYLGHGKHTRFRRRCTVPVQNIQLCHNFDHTSGESAKPFRICRRAIEVVGGLEELVTAFAGGIFGLCQQGGDLSFGERLEGFGC